MNSTDKLMDDDLFAELDSTTTTTTPTTNIEKQGVIVGEALVETAVVTINDTNSSTVVTDATNVQQPEKKSELTLTNSDLAFADKVYELPSLIGKKEEYPPDFLEISELVLERYKNMPILNFDDLYAELSSLSVKASPTPTLQILNLELEKVQGAKDRLSEIFNSVLRNHTFKKRVVDMLRDSWGKYTSEKNAEARKGDANIRISKFELDLAETEALLKTCLHVLKNLDSHHDVLSRKITIIQLQLKLYDLGRGNSLPDFDFDKNILASSEDDVWGGKPKKDIDKTASIEAKEQTW